MKGKRKYMKNIINNLRQRGTKRILRTCTETDVNFGRATNPELTWLNMKR